MYNPTPGEILLKDFMQPTYTTLEEIVERTTLTPQQITDIIDGVLVITPDIDEKLSQCFKVSKGYWLRLQQSYDDYLHFN